MLFSCSDLPSVPVLMLAQGRVGVRSQEWALALLAAPETGEQFEHLHKYSLSGSASLGMALGYCVLPASHP